MPLLLHLDGTYILSFSDCTLMSMPHTNFSIKIQLCFEILPVCEKCLSLHRDRIRSYLVSPEAYNLFRPAGRAVQWIRNPWAKRRVAILGKAVVVLKPPIWRALWHTTKNKIDKEFGGKIIMRMWLRASNFFFFFAHFLQFYCRKCEWFSLLFIYFVMIVL